MSIQKNARAVVEPGSFFSHWPRLTGMSPAFPILPEDFHLW